MKRKVQVKRGTQAKAEVSPAWVQGQILWTLRELGVDKMLEAQDTIQINLDIIYIILSDMRSTVQLASASTASARSKLEEYFSSLATALENIGNMLPSQEPETNAKLRKALEHTARFRDMIEMAEALRDRESRFDQSATDILDFLSEEDSPEGRQHG